MGNMLIISRLRGRRLNSSPKETPYKERLPVQCSVTPLELVLTAENYSRGEVENYSERPERWLGG